MRNQTADPARLRCGELWMCVTSQSKFCPKSQPRTTAGRRRCEDRELLHRCTLPERDLVLLDVNYRDVRLAMVPSTSRWAAPLTDQDKWS